MRSGLALVVLLLVGGCKSHPEVAAEPLLPFVETPSNVTLAQFTKLYSETCLAHIREYPDFEGLERKLLEIGFRITDETFYSKVLFNDALGSEIVFARVRNHADTDEGSVYFAPIDYCTLTGAINDYGSLTPELLETSLGYDFGIDQDPGDEFYFELEFLEGDRSNRIEVMSYRAHEDRRFRQSSFPPECVNLQECEVRRIVIDLQSQQSHVNG
jgi:hypothetical protein